MEEPTPEVTPTPEPTEIPTEEPIVGELPEEEEMMFLLTTEQLEGLGFDLSAVRSFEKIDDNVKLIYFDDSEAVYNLDYKLISLIDEEGNVCEVIPTEDNEVVNIKIPAKNWVLTYDTKGAKITAVYDESINQFIDLTVVSESTLSGLTSGIKILDAVGDIKANDPYEGDLLNKARDYFNAGEYDNAISSCEEFIEVFEEDAMLKRDQLEILGGMDDAVNGVEWGKIFEEYGTLINMIEIYDIMIKSCELNHEDSKAEDYGNELKKNYPDYIDLRTDQVLLIGARVNFNEENNEISILYANKLYNIFGQIKGIQSAVSAIAEVSIYMVVLNPDGVPGDDGKTWEEIYEEYHLFTRDQVLTSAVRENWKTNPVYAKECAEELYEIFYNLGLVIKKIDKGDGNASC